MLPPRLYAPFWLSPCFISSPQDIPLSTPTPSFGVREFKYTRFFVFCKTSNFSSRYFFWRDRSKHLQLPGATRSDRSDLKRPEDFDFGGGGSDQDQERQEQLGATRSDQEQPWLFFVFGSDIPLFWFGLDVPIDGSFFLSGPICLGWSCVIAL